MNLVTLSINWSVNVVEIGAQLVVGSVVLDGVTNSSLDEECGENNEFHL